jgi:hypothetical protein
MDSDQKAFVFFGIWMLLVFANAIFMFTSRNTALKRRVATIGIAAVSLLMVGVTVLMGAAWLGLLMVPVLVLVVAFNARKIRFCDACGMTNVLSNPFKSEAFCSECGKPLDPNRMWF